MVEETKMEKVIPAEKYTELVSITENYLGHTISKIESLKGDGSDRCIYRIYGTENLRPSVVGVIHHNIGENRDFLLLAQKFQEIGLPVPLIFSVNSDENAYLMQDLGNDTLADKVKEWNSENRNDKIIDSYKLVLDRLITMQHELPSVLTRFFKNRIMDVSVYQADLDYFRRDFVERFDFKSLLNASVIRELQSILFDHLVDLDVGYFVYRDFQARNIMWYDDSPWFIDFQSAFLGPRYYDMASLLYGSKSGLNEQERELLNKYYFRLLESASSFSFEDYTGVFFLFVVLRRLRSLGTYGFLSGEKGKAAFFDSIYPTLEELVGLFDSQSCLQPYENLFGMIKKVKDIWEQQADSFRPGL